LYSEIITPEQFQTFKDGQPYAYFNNEFGEEIPEWPNDYGFVPMVVVQHKDIGKRWGASGFHNSVNKIDFMNDLASNLHVNIRKTVNPMLHLAGATTAGKIRVEEVGRDNVPIITTDKDATLTPIGLSIDIMGTLEVIRDRLAELERDMPELALARLRDFGTPPSGIAAQTMYQDALQRIQEAHGNYAATLVRAQKMALYIGAQNSYKGYTQLANRSMDDLEHQIQTKRLFGDKLSKSEKVQVMQQAQFPIHLIAEELGYDDDESLVIESQIKAERATEVASFIQQTLSEASNGQFQLE
jgi:hypothetical protein